MSESVTTEGPALHRLFSPERPWWLAYSPSNLSPDLRAGVTIGVVLVPQSMAYAMLAGLPASFGLFSAFLPVLVYAVTGTSRHLAIGPVALDSLLVAQAAGAIAGAGSPDYLAGATLLAGMVGGLQLLLGVLRFGFVSNFLSRPVLSGFTSAAALVIVGSQLKHIFGVDLPTFFRAPFDALIRVHVLTLVIAALTAALIIGTQRIHRTFPGALAASLLACGADLLFDLQGLGVATVGNIRAGFQQLAMPSFELGQARALLPSALALAIVGFTESISGGKSFAAKYGYPIDPNRELLALGGANLAAWLSGGFPVAGGLSRSAVAEQAGIRTQLAAVVSALVVLLAIVVLTPLFAHLPRAVLAAIVVIAASSLLNTRELLRLWRVRRADAGLLLATFLATLIFGVIQGVTLGALLSLGMFIHRTTRPHTVELWRIPGSNVFRNPKNFPEARPVPGVLILRMDASFYFANVAFFKERLDSLLAETSRPVSLVILDASSINDLDSSAELALREVTNRLRSIGMDLCLANVKGPVLGVMRRSGFLEFLGQEHVFLDLAQAVAANRASPNQDATMRRAETLV